MTIRSLFITLLLLVLLLIHFTYLSYLSLFQTLELTKEYGFVWKQRESDGKMADHLYYEESRETAVTDYVSGHQFRRGLIFSARNANYYQEKERQQLELFADVEQWCSPTNYTVEGEWRTKWYRKSSNKNIWVHHSAHPRSIKKSVIANMFRTAKNTASGAKTMQFAYRSRRQSNRTRVAERNMRSVENMIPFCLLYVSEEMSKAVTACLRQAGLQDSMIEKYFTHGDIYQPLFSATFLANTTLPSPIELAKLHKKEDIWGELGNSALIITNNFPWQSSIGLLQRMYQPYFKTTVFCGTFYPAFYLKNDGFPAIVTPFNYINLTEEEVHQGFFVYLCLVKASYLVRAEVEGFFMMSNDATFNFWHTIDLHRVFHPTGITYESYEGLWWPSPYGKTAVDNALNLITNKYRTSLRIQKMWKKYQDGLVTNGFIKSANQELVEIDGWCMSDFFYVPATEMQYFCDLMIIFFEAQVFHEIAVSKYLHTIPHNRAEETQYLYLWESDREKWDELYSEELIMIHPIKFSQLLDLRQRSRYCNTVVRTFKQSLFPTTKLILPADSPQNQDLRNSKEVEEK